MKVLQINSVYKTGSTGKIVYELHNALLDRGYESRVCYGRGSIENDPFIYKFSSNTGVNLHALISRLFGLTGFASNWSTNRLIKYIEEYSPDIVHLHNIHGYYLNMYRVINYLKNNNTRVIWTFHDELMFTGNCGYGDGYRCNKWKEHCRRCEYKGDYPKSYIFDFAKLQLNYKKKVFKNFNNLTIVSPSKWFLERINKSFLGEKNNICIYNGIELKYEFFPRNVDKLKKSLLKQKKKIILHVTSNFEEEQKGGKHVLEIADIMKDDSVLFIVVGNREFYDKYKKYNNIIFIGKIDSKKELAEYYSLADATIITSMGETFSLVCAESLACGTPVIGFDVGAPTEVAPYPHGIFVEYGNYEKLVSVIKKLKYKNDKIEEQCRNYSLMNYDKDKMINNYIEEYRKRVM